MTTPHIGNEDELVTADQADDETEQPEQHPPHSTLMRLIFTASGNTGVVRLRSTRKHLTYRKRTICSSESHDAALPWPRSATHFQHTPWRTQMSLEEAKTALNGYFAPKRNVVAERYKFRSRAQKADESFDAYLTSLRELVKSCDFGTLEEEMIRDQIVEKCSSQTLRVCP